MKLAKAIFAKSVSGEYINDLGVRYGEYINALCSVRFDWGVQFDQAARLRNGAIGCCTLSIGPLSIAIGDWQMVADSTRLRQRGNTNCFYT